MFQKFVDKKRVKQAIQFYFKKQEESSSLTEDEICRLLLRNWIYHSSPMKNVDEIDKYIREIFKNEITISDVCYFGIKYEFSGKYHFNRQKNKNLEEFSKVLDNLKDRINKELKKYELKNK